VQTLATRRGTQGPVGLESGGREKNKKNSEPSSNPLSYPRDTCSESLQLQPVQAHSLPRSRERELSLSLSLPPSPSLPPQVLTQGARAARGPPVQASVGSHVHARAGPAQPSSLIPGASRARARGIGSARPPRPSARPSRSRPAVSPASTGAGSSPQGATAWEAERAVTRCVEIGAEH
jgi:hypothetical protein